MLLDVVPKSKKYPFLWCPLGFREPELLMSLHQPELAVPYHRRTQSLKLPQHSLLTHQFPLTSIDSTISVNVFLCQSAACFRTRFMVSELLFVQSVSILPKVGSLSLVFSFPFNLISKCFRNFLDLSAQYVAKVSHLCSINIVSSAFTIPSSSKSLLTMMFYLLRTHHDPQCISGQSASRK